MMTKKCFLSFGWIILAALSLFYSPSVSSTQAQILYPPRLNSPSIIERSNPVLLKETPLSSSSFDIGSKKDQPKLSFEDQSYNVFFFSLALLVGWAGLMSFLCFKSTPILWPVLNATPRHHTVHHPHSHHSHGHSHSHSRHHHRHRE